MFVQAIKDVRKSMFPIIRITETSKNNFQLSVVGTGFYISADGSFATVDRPQVFEPPGGLVWELVLGCSGVVVRTVPTEGGRRPTGVGTAVSWAA